MPDSLQVSVDQAGLANALRQLDRLDLKRQPTVVRGELRKATKPAIEMAKRLVPYDEWNNQSGYSLRDAMGVRSEKKKNRPRGVIALLRVGPHLETATAETSPGYAIAGGLSKNPRAPNYAAIVERDSPYLEPSFHANVRTMTQLFAKGITARITKEIAKLSK